MLVNTLDITLDNNNRQEEAVITTDALSPEMSDADFAAAVDSQITDAKAYWNKRQLDKRQKINDKYWVGDQVDASSLRDDLEKGVDNAIFRNIETFIPIANSQTPEITATPAYKNDKTRAFAGDIKRVLQAEWEVYQEMGAKMSQVIRNHNIDLLGAVQYGIDPDTNELWTEVLLATDCVISQHGDFVAKYINNQTLGDVLARFPEKKEEILKYLGIVGTEPTKTALNSPFKYVEVWTDKMVGWKINHLVLGKEANPHFDNEGRVVRTATGQPAMGPDGTPVLGPDGQPVMGMQETKVKYNHFKSPRMPFLFMSYWNRGKGIYDDTTLIEQGIGPQDWINKRKRQIGANADSTNGNWASSGDYISFEEFSKIQGGIDEKIWLENGRPGEGLAKITGPQLPEYIYRDLTDSRMAIDNLMGTHSTTRGEKSGNNTASQDLIARDQDYGRVDGYVRDAVERFAQQWAAAMYHMMLVYKIEEEAIAIPEEDDFEQDNVFFSRDSVPLIQKKSGETIPVPLILRVKKGSTMPIDDVSRYKMAQDSKDILAPIDYFKMTGQANPRELTKNLLLWQMDPYSFFKDDPDIQAAVQQKKQAEAAAAQAAMAAEAAKNGGGNPPIPADGGAKPPASTEGEGSGPTGMGVGNALRAIMSGKAPGGGTQ